MFLQKHEMFLIFFTFAVPPASTHKHLLWLTCLFWTQTMVNPWIMCPTHVNTI